MDEIDFNKIPYLLELIKINGFASTSLIQAELPAGFNASRKYLNFLIEHNFVSKDCDKNNRYPAIC